MVVTIHDTRSGDAVASPAICLGETRTDLPAACTQLVTVANDSGTRLDVDGRQVLTDAVDVRWAERVARVLAPLVPAPAGEAVLPSQRTTARRARPRRAGVDSASLDSQRRRRTATDRHRPGRPAGARPRPPWAARADRRNDRRRQVAAVAHHGRRTGQHVPADELSFLLIDYKGGSAFAECAALPHVVGMVTDLDEQLTARALASLRSELRRRERLFAAAGASDLGEYRASAAQPALPRLMIVVDEYATLAAELPDFVAGLTGIAQRGRSLGLHLVLATQRPAGVVTADVRANCSLRIALRVTDVGDSRDVIDGPQSAAIAHDLPGRAYVWQDGTARPVQVARSDLPDETAAARRLVVQQLGPWRSLVPCGSNDTAASSELAAYVAAVARAASGCPRAAAPWLPPLPDAVGLDTLPVPPQPGAAAIGLVDLPSSQARSPLVLDLRSGCSVLLAGAPRTGRTSALAAIALAAAGRHPPDELHIHAIDVLGDLGAALAGLPHCGTLATPADGMELADALLRELGAEADSDTCALLLVDGWDGFVRASEDWDGGASIERLLGLVRAGRHGRTIVIAGDRSALAPRLRRSGHHQTAAPAARPQRCRSRRDTTGRGSPDDAGRSGVARPGRHRGAACPSGPGTDAKRVGGRSAGLRGARRWAIDRAAPARFADRARRRRVAAPGPHGAVRRRRTPRTAVELPLSAPVRLLVVGPARSGRSTTLTTVLHQAVRAGHAVSVVAPARSSLRAAARRLGARGVDPSGDASVVDEFDGVVLVDDSERLRRLPARRRVGAPSAAGGAGDGRGRPRRGRRSRVSRTRGRDEAQPLRPAVASRAGRRRRDRRPVTSGIPGRPARTRRAPRRPVLGRSLGARAGPGAGGAGAGGAGRMTSSAHVWVAMIGRRCERLLDRARRRPAHQVPQRPGLVVRARGARAAERLLADDRAGRLVVDVEVAGREPQHVRDASSTAARSRAKTAPVSAYGDDRFQLHQVSRHAASS